MYGIKRVMSLLQMNSDDEGSPDPIFNMSGIEDVSIDKIPAIS